VLVDSAISGADTVFSCGSHCVAHSLHTDLRFNPLRRLYIRSGEITK